MTPEFYINVDINRGEILERYIDVDGQDQIRSVNYSPTLFVHTQEESEYKDIYGKYAKPRKFDDISSCRQWMRETKGIVEVMGMDDFRLAYISDIYKQDVEFDKSKIRTVYFDIEVTGVDFPEPMLAVYEIDAITHYDSIDDAYYVFDLTHSTSATVDQWCAKLAAKAEAEGGDEIPQHILDRVVYMPFDNERELLLEYINLFEQKPPAVLTGWNIEKFDIPYVMNRIKNVLGQTFVKRMSPFGRVTSKVMRDKYDNEMEVFTIAGMNVLDYMDLYIKFGFTTQPSYSLDYISDAETDVSKLVYDGPINKLRETNHQRYISYNIIDVYCVQMIDKKRGFIDLSLALAYYAKINIGSVLSPVKTWDAILFNSLKETKVVLPESQSHIKQKFPGAFVKEIPPSLQKYVMSFDLTSLYPSIIRQVNISPETIRGMFSPGTQEQYIDKTAPRPSSEFSCAPNGMMYDKVLEGIIPIETTKMFVQRKEWKKKMITAEQNAEVIKSILARRKK